MHIQTIYQDIISIHFLYTEEDLHGDEYGP